MVGRRRIRPSRRGDRERPERRPRRDIPDGECPSAQAGTSCTQSTSGSSAVASSIISSRNACRPGGTVLPWKRFQLRTSTHLRYCACACSSPTRPRSRPGTTTSWPAALARRAPTSRLRRRGFASASFPRRRLPAQRALLSALVAALQALAPAPAAEGGRAPRGDAPRSPSQADVLHLQWLALPQADVRLRFRSPSVFTAHDLLPRRTAGKRDLWRRLLRRFDRVVVHTERGRETLARARRRRARHSPPGLPEHGDARRRRPTLLSLGVIRPYKGLPDAIEVTRRLPDARLLVAGDPAMPLDGLRDAARRVAARLPAAVRARPRALRGDGRGVPLPRRARPVGRAPAGARRRRPRGRLRRRRAWRADRAYGAGRVVPAGDVEALTEAVRELLDDRDALAAPVQAPSARAAS